MTVNPQFQRSRGIPNGSSTDPSQASSTDVRNGGVGALSGTMSRAEKFEDEKRRIIESCFGRTDADGSVSESYITHIRIVEDAAFPSSPPPPQSPEENKKPRIVIVAVRKSGRVRMHKARENANGSFSIGKTWVLDDLAAIESFVGTAPLSREEQQRKEWAGNVGFLVTIQKPYYWQASTPKEKDFFIGSLIKIYRKYTGGKLPELYGFSQQELDQLTGIPAQQPRTPQAPSSRPSPAPVSSKSSSSEQAPILQHGLHRDPNREASREPRPHQTNTSHPRKIDSQEQEVSIPGQFPTSDFVRNIRPQDSRSRFQALRSDSPSTLDTRNDSPGPPSTEDSRSLRSLGGTQSTESFSSRRDQQGYPFPQNANPSVERLRANGVYPLNTRGDPPSRQGTRSPGSPISSTPRVGTPPALQQRQEMIPERKRPPILIPNNQSQRSLNTDSPQEFATPTATSIRSKPATPISDDRTRLNFARGIEEQQQKPSKEYFSRPILPASEQEESHPKEPLEHVKTEPVVLSDSQESTRTISKSSTIVDPSLSADPPVVEEEHRPGLGPMIKKKSTKEIANAFRKAAMAHNAFKPRAGGGADKIKGESMKSPNTPDGINGVFPAPSFLRDLRQDNAGPTPVQTPISGEFLAESLKALQPEQVNNLPEVKITASPAITTTLPETPTSEIPPSVNPSLQRPASTESSPQEERRRKRPSQHSAKYAKALRIDPNLLEGRTFDIESVLSDFGWGEEESERKSYDDLQNEIRRDLARVETGSWLGNFEHNDERVAVVGKLLDKAIAECEELDGLLTLYNVELGTLSEDVAYIEAQSQGLQVQTANQRLLHTELQTLLETISISSSQLRVLKDASLTKAQGIQSIEAALVELYKAMLTIDPKLRQSGSRPDSSNRNSTGDRIGNEISTMRAVQEKREGYRKESIDFVQRLKQHLDVKFQGVEVELSSLIQKGRSGALSRSSTKLDLRLRDTARARMWIYSPLMLFAREIDSFEWREMMRVYESAVKKSYQEEFRDNISAWKRTIKKPSSEEQESLFTTQEKDSEGIVSRKLTVKRTKTVRTDGSGRISSGEKPRTWATTGYEAFAGALYDMAQSIFVEQNFLVDFFHVSSLENLDFPDAVAAAPPESRKDGNLLEKKLFDPDRQMARRVQEVMDDMYSFWPSEMEELVDLIFKQDTLQGIGVLFALETKLAELEETNQDYLTQTLSKILSKLTSRFDRFIDEQIRAIEDTKVKIKKRKGVIAFMKTFPYFSSTVENMLPAPRANRFEVRHMVNEIYSRINKAMFESLKFIAKESPVVQKQQAATVGDTEDKEILNYHILLIENMNHYVEEVEVRDNPVLEEWKTRAVNEMKKHMDLYLAAVIRRPLGKLLDFLESTESLLAHSPDGSAIATRASHSRSTFKKLLSTFDAKEIRRGIETLKKRVEKHFGDADDPGLSRNLVQKVLRECEEEYGRIYERTGRIVREVYEGELEIEFKREDVGAAFRR